jgi:type I restriction enzyme M protein
MRRSNCASALQYVPELTWILFLRILDAQEEREREEAEVLGQPFYPALREPYRWQDWAAPYDEKAESFTPEGKRHGWKREALKTRDGDLFAFINRELLPYLHRLDMTQSGQPNLAATPKQRVIARIMTAVERVRVDSEANLCDILDLVDEISIDHIDDTHFFTLSQVYEDLLLKMGEKNSDGGQFFTPREVIRAMVRTLDPEPGETIYDPCCGTGGFLAQAYELISKKLETGNAAATHYDTLKHKTFFGREKENLVFPIALANLVLHGIDQPNLWHGNTLLNSATYGGLFEDAPPTFDVILTNPPFGGKEGRDAQKNFDFETSATQVLFLQQVLKELKPAMGGKPGGRCGVVLDGGLLFRTNESAFVETKRKLLDECELWCIVSLPGGVFSTAGAGVKTNLLFFTKGKKTERIWYYDLSYVKTGKKSPMTLGHFGWGPNGEMLDDASLPPALLVDWREQEGNTAKPFPSFARLLAKRGNAEAESDFSWTVDFSDRRAKAREDMAPHLAEVEQRKNEAVALKEAIAKLKKAKAPEEDIATQREALAAVERAEREAQAKAAAIDAACFDLKAVNPRARVERDTRTAAQVLESIASHGRTVDDALARLRRLMEEAVDED